MAWHGMAWQGEAQAELRRRIRLGVKDGGRTEGRAGVGESWQRGNTGGGPNGAVPLQGEGKSGWRGTGCHNDGGAKQPERARPRANRKGREREIRREKESNRSTEREGTASQVRGKPAATTAAVERRDSSREYRALVVGALRRVEYTVVVCTTTQRNS